MTDDTPTIAERYARATNSKRLRTIDFRVTDLDVLIAAGYIREGLGTTLYRLKSEMDAVSRQEAAQAGNDETARLLLFMKLRSLKSVSTAVHAYALQSAGRQAYEGTLQQVADVVAKTMDLFLAPNCPRCEGRGYWGGYGTPQVLCPSPIRGGCGTTGRRPLRGLDEAGRQFAHWLLAEMERKLSDVDSALINQLKGRA